MVAIHVFMICLAYTCTCIDVEVEN